MYILLRQWRSKRAREIDGGSPPLVTMLIFEKGSDLRSNLYLVWRVRVQVELDPNNNYNLFSSDLCDESFL